MAGGSAPQNMTVYGWHLRRGGFGPDPIRGLTAHESVARETAQRLSLDYDCEAVVTAFPVDPVVLTEADTPYPRQLLVFNRGRLMGDGSKDDTRDWPTIVAVDGGARRKAGVGR